MLDLEPPLVGDGFHGVTGAIRFSEDGDPLGKKITMTRIKQGVLLVETNQ